MQVSRPETPFGDDPVDEIALADSPLVAVVAQLRFPTIASIARAEFVGPFQEALRPHYPVLRQERAVGLLVTQAGVSATGDPGHVWRFHDRSHTWSVSLSSEFLSLDTTAYVDRADFLDRLGRVLGALAECIEPATVDRFGLRYVDRIVLGGGEGLGELGDLVRPELRGLATSPLGPGAELTHTVADAQFELADCVLHARWGILPAGVQLDPLHGPPSDAPAWLLDLDMFTEKPTGFDVGTFRDLAACYADRIYRFFRWSIEPGLIRRSGGLP